MTKEEYIALYKEILKEKIAGLDTAPEQGEEDTTEESGAGDDGSADTDAGDPPEDD